MASTRFIGANVRTIIKRRLRAEARREGVSITAQLENILADRYGLSRTINENIRGRFRSGRRPATRMKLFPHFRALIISTGKSLAELREVCDLSPSILRKALGGQVISMTPETSRKLSRLAKSVGYKGPMAR